MENTEAPTKRKSIIKHHSRSMLKGVRPGWRRVILSDKVGPVMKRTLVSLDHYLLDKGVTKYLAEERGLDIYIRPRVRDIFRAMRYFDPQNLRVIIIGQDPYMKKEEANGLSFSVPKDVALPSSLRNIYNALLSQGLITSMPKHGDLTGWAKQGVLLLNKYLTRSPNIMNNGKEIWIEGNGGTKKECMHEFWDAFTDELIRYLTTDFLRDELNHHRHTIHVFLWGNKAHACESVINHNLPPMIEVKVHKWGHPSALNRYNNDDENPENFKHCDHFAKVPEINWDPSYKMEFADALLDQFYTKRCLGEDLNMEYITNALRNDKAYDDATNSDHNKIIRDLLDVVKKQPTPVIPVTQERTTVAIVKPVIVIAAIDGGCKGNGKSDAKGGFGVYFPKSIKSEKFSADNISELVNTKMYGNIPTQLMELKKDRKFVYTDSDIKRTNNRGELLAAIHALHKIVDTLLKKGPHPVILVLDSEYVMKFINYRFWNAYKKDSKLTAILKNRDLTIILGKLLLALSKLVPNGRDCESAWEVLIQPIARITEDSKAIQDQLKLDWGGLTLFYTESHKEKKKIAIPAEHTLEYNWHRFNEVADELCEIPVKMCLNDTDVYTM
jgi:uracil-DNA glycosylase